MSMNLHIKADGEELSLLQTPTHITYMCLVNSKGEIKGQINGKKALRAVHAYLLWVDQTLDGEYKDHPEDFQSARENVLEHKRYILNSISSCKNLEVYFS